MAQSGSWLSRALGLVHRTHPAQPVAAAVAVAQGAAVPGTYSTEFQARTGRAHAYYQHFERGRHGGLWGACLLLVDMNDRIADLEQRLTRAEGAIRVAAIRDNDRPARPARIVR